MTKNKNQKSSETASAKVRWHNNLARKFISSKCGATAIEYALIAGGVSIVIVAAVRLVGVNVTALFASAQSAF